MANHCYNEIFLIGKDEESIKELKDRLTGTYDKFNYLNGWCDYVLKVRDDFDYNFDEDKRAHYFYGSRWFDFEVDYDDDNTLQINGDSAWSPMEKFTEELCKVYNLSGNLEYRIISACSKIVKCSCCIKTLPHVVTFNCGKGG